MQSQDRSRFKGVFSLLDLLKRGRNRRRRQLPASLTPASESLETRTLLSAVDAFSISSTPLTPAINPAPGSEIGYTNGEAVFKTGIDVEISWNPELDSKDFDIRIYDVEKGQEVVNENHLSSPEFLPTNLTKPGRYQVFIRHTDVSDQTGDWSSPVYFHLTAGVGETPPEASHFIGVTNDPGPALTWTAVNVHGFVTSYEVVIYNVAAGHEVLRESNLTGTSLSLDTLLDSSDGFQAFIRTNYNPPIFEDSILVGQPSFGTAWSAPFHFRGEGPSLIPPAPVLNLLESAIQWEPIPAAESYEIVVYDVAAGREVIRATGITEASFDGPDVFSQGDTTFQVFYRTRQPDGLIGLWSRPLEFSSLIWILAAGGD